MLPWRNLRLILDHNGRLNKMILEIEIKNWAKYNPRSDVKSCSWFRMSNDFFSDPDFYGCSLEARIVWIFALSVASKKMSQKVRLNTSMISDNLKIPHKEIEKSLVELEETGSIIIFKSNVILARSNPIVPKMLPSATNERTDRQTNNIVSGFFESENPDIEEIKADQLAINVLTALNSICFLDHRPNKTNMGFINARIKEKYTFEDFVAVINHKQATWSDDPKMSQYLRPKTLFCTNFDGYLQAAKNALKPKTDPLNDFFDKYAPNTEVGA
jgi:uncharacterized phage protein (TIGR02220 family)